MRPQPYRAASAAAVRRRNPAGTARPAAAPTRSAHRLPAPAAAPGAGPAHTRRRAGARRCFAGRSRSSRCWRAPATPARWARSGRSPGTARPLAAPAGMPRTERPERTCRYPAAAAAAARRGTARRPAPMDLRRARGRDPQGRPPAPRPRRARQVAAGRSGGPSSTRRRRLGPAPTAARLVRPPGSNTGHRPDRPRGPSLAGLPAAGRRAPRRQLEPRTPAARRQDRPRSVAPRRRPPIGDRTSLGPG